MKHCMKHYRRYLQESALSTSRNISIFSSISYTLFRSRVEDKFIILEVGYREKNFIPAAIKYVGRK